MAKVGIQCLNINPNRNSTQESVLVLYSAYSTPSHAISNARPSIDQKRSVMVVEGGGERGEGGM